MTTELGDEQPLLGGQSKREPVGNASLMSSIANLANTVLGTGMLATPHAFASGGLLAGAITTLVCGMTAGFGLYLLSRAAAKTTSRGASFASLAALTLPAFSRLFDLAIFLKCFGVSISYLIIVGSLAPLSIRALSTTPDPIFLDRRLWIMVAMLVLTPLAFYRRLDSLKMISYVALCAVANLIFVVIYKFIEPSGIPSHPPIIYFNLNLNWVTSLPVQIFAFTCAQNLFAVFNELKDNSQERLNIVIGSSIGSAAVIYELLGTLGYLTFGAAVGSNIIEMYPHSILVSICQLAIVILVLFSYPLQLHPCRASLHNLLQPRLTPIPSLSSSTADTDQSSSSPSAQEIPLLWFIGETAAILTASFIISIYVTKLETVLGFVGATGSTTISFILPALFFISLFRNTTNPTDKKLVIAAGALLVWGIGVMVVALSINVWHLLQTKEKETVVLFIDRFLT